MAPQTNQNSVVAMQVRASTLKFVPNEEELLSDICFMVSILISVGMFQVLGSM